MLFVKKLHNINIDLITVKEKMNSQIDEVEPVITIDGPAGSGKGTISQRVANTLGWHILDSGALYRLVALAVLKKEISLDDNEEEIYEVAEKLDVVFQSENKNSVQILLDGENVTSDIRAERCGDVASKVAALKSVRKALFHRQRQFLQKPGLVADGRDMGTVVFPEAKLKIFLTASTKIRGERRLNQLKEQGINANLHGLIRDIEERDARDMHRKDAPLVPADDAIMIDTSELSIDEVVDLVLNAQAKMN